MAERNLRNIAPTQWALTEKETISSFNAWRSNLLYILNLNPAFTIFLQPGVTWTQRTRVPNDTRGFVGDLIADAADPAQVPAQIPDPNGYTALQKVANLELCLGQIANFSPIIYRNTIEKESTSLDFVWRAIKLHYGFQTSGGNFIDFVNIRFTPPERAETLYQRMLAFIGNNLMSPNNGIMHRGRAVAAEEDITPTIENLIVLLWLRELHPNLPNVVKQKYGADLRLQSLASLKPEISLALDSLMEEAKMNDNGRVNRTGQQPTFNRNNVNNRFGRPSQGSFANRSNFNKRRPPSGPGRSDRRSYPAKECPLCKAANRTNFQHFLSACKFLPKTDRDFMSRARQVLVEDEEDDAEEDNDDYDDDYCDQDDQVEAPSHHRRVNVRPSPEFNTFYDHNSLTITLDTGAETNLMRESVARAIKCPIEASSQVAYQADGSSQLDVVGETHVVLTRDNLSFTFSGLIVNDLDVDILAGVPFMEENDISVRPRKKLITVGDSHRIPYSSSTPSYCANNRASVLRATCRSTVWPGEFLELAIEASPDSEVAIEPHISSKFDSWPEIGVYKAVGNMIRLRNDTTSPVTINKNSHLGMLSTTFVPEPSTDAASTCKTSTLPREEENTRQCHNRDAPSDAPSATVRPVQLHGLFHSDSISVDPDKVLSKEDRDAFKSLVREYDEVFDPAYSTYNHAFGRFEAVVNMGAAKPPQRKGRVPQYSRGKLAELQTELDRLEDLGVFAKPEKLDITVEYINPTFLVKDPKRDKFRLVTAFSEVGSYCKPQPSLLPDVDSTLRTIGQWKYIVKSDLTSAYFQIPLQKDSMKYCGIATPFKGIRCYTRCAMGMPGSETALEELMCRILGDLLSEGYVTKIADDLYCGGDTPEDLMHNWEEVLRRLAECNMKLSAMKTVIAPAETVVLGWIWLNGKLKADPHKIAPLSVCSQPTTTKGLRSYLGAYKVLARVIPGCAKFLQPLEQLTHGKKSADKLEWNDSSVDAFKRSQAHLQSSRVITLPNENDQLWLVTDGASSNSGIGATLYVVRDNSLKVAGFFSQQLSPTHRKWLPCEIEGISIAAAIRYFDGYIVQSKHRTQVLTDNKPCVDAYRKLLRGQFSSNARLSTFLSSVSRHHVLIQHLSGAANLPADFASRNPVICNEPKCQICSFSKSIDECVVRGLTIRDVVEGRQQLPFTSRKAWLLTQSECRDLRRTRAHLLQGTRPTKKENTVKSVKRYLGKVDIASDGLLIVRSTNKLAPQKEAIVIPEGVLPGLLTALHLRLSHPSTAELSKVFKRYFWALNADQAILSAYHTCHTCASLQKFPTVLVPQSTSDPPAGIGSQFAADVMVRERQKILIVREYVSSLTRGRIIQSEREDDLREGVIQLISDMVTLDGPPAVVRTDGAPGFRSLIEDTALLDHRITIEVGRTKNVNKNPVAEKAVQEAQAEILRTTGQNGPITPSTLNDAMNNLNSRIRTDGLSAREIFFQRDQFTNAQIPVEDMHVIQSKHNRAVNNNLSSELSKSGGRGPRINQSINVGDLIYLISDRSKNSPRDRYLVVSIEDEWCNIRKFIGNTLKSNSYRVKMAEIYKVPPTTLTMQQPDMPFHNPTDDVIMITTTNEHSASESPLPNSPPRGQPPANMPSQVLPLPSADMPCDQVSDVSHQSTTEDVVTRELPSIEAPQTATPPPVIVATLPPTPPEVLTRPEPTSGPVSSEQQPQPRTRPQRVRRPPAYLRDYDLSS